jgi:O-acetyl-ADP-ribose deacetylase (regulator of RNase III)
MQLGNTRIDIVRGDITTHAADAIVNAANTSLLGGGGVDGAIHRKGGPDILEECRKIVARIGRCPTGEAVATTAGRLPAKMVVHTVGPVWQGGSAREDELLAGAWTRSLEVAAERGARTVAFPAISTGAYGYPMDRAARVSLGALAAFLRSRPGAFDEVSVVLFRDADTQIWNSAATTLLGRIHDGP